LDAKAWFAEKLPEFEKLNFPNDWREVVKNYFTDNYISQFEMESTEPTWQMIERRLQETLPKERITSIKVIQNIFLW
jgi:hypothetical protein